MRRNYFRISLFLSNIVNKCYWVSSSINFLLFCARLFSLHWTNRHCALRCTPCQLPSSNMTQITSASNSVSLSEKLINLWVFGLPICSCSLFLRTCFCHFWGGFILHVFLDFLFHDNHTRKMPQLYILSFCFKVI